MLSLLSAWFYKYGSKDIIDGGCGDGGINVKYMIIDSVVFHMLERCSRIAVQIAIVRLQFAIMFVRGY